PQDPNDAPASELLRSIEQEKQRLVKEGKIKASKPLPEIEPEELPYRLPIILKTAKGWTFYLTLEDLLCKGLNHFV
ncbi:MAG: DUF169 domain-containing protein, partial [Chamaesiphon sp.]|nr:DUF169 domain-containing protein [Chamaesiphon sp.]